MQKNIGQQKGISILGVIFLGFIIVLVLSYFNISIKAVVESPTGQENVNFIQKGVQNFWNKYLAKPTEYLWNDVWLNIFWKGFIYNMERIRDGKSTDFDDAARNLEIQQ